jgi:hypothetical protein
MKPAFTGGGLRRVFLSHSFAEHDRVRVSQVESLLRSHGLAPANGRTLGGGELTPEIAAEIERCDAMVAVLTQRPDGTAPNNTHPWVEAEFSHARMREMRAIGIYQNVVAQRGFDAGKEHILYDPADPLPTFLRLSDTIGAWRRATGRYLKIMIMPKGVAEKARARVDHVRCECRFEVQGGAQTEWMAARVQWEADGVYVALHVPEDVDRVQIRLDSPLVETPFSEIWPAMQFKRRS